MKAAFNTDKIPNFHQTLHGWYQRHGRKDLPWREIDAPYPIWLSEVMLQQTQVKTVLERYYFPFLKAFPTIESLAAADLQTVLKQWEGLGYYNRARNLHRAAQQVVEQGGFPQTVEGLMALPGIGKNTAHAVASFAYHQPVPVLEANVKRVVARIGTLKTPRDKELWTLAEALLDNANPFDYNQAMMDVGALICTPKAPRCGECPAHGICGGKGEPEAYPQKKAKKKLPVRERKIVLFEHEGSYHMTPREERFLHGLWQFPEVDAAEEKIRFANKSYAIATMQPLGEVVHSYSHFHLKANVYRQPLEGRPMAQEHWIPQREIRALPLSRTEQKILRLLTK